MLQLRSDWLIVLRCVRDGQETLCDAETFIAEEESEQSCGTTQNRDFTEPGDLKVKSSSSSARTLRPLRPLS